MAILNDLLVNGNTRLVGNVTASGALVVGADPTENLQVATKQYVDNTAGTGGSDEKVQVSALASGTTYYPILAVGVGTATRQADTTGGGFKYTATLGTSSSGSIGTALLQLGNSLYTAQANNMAGVLRIYEAGNSGAGSAFYSDIRGDASTANCVIYLPRGSSSHTTSYLVAAGNRGVAIGSATTPVYVDTEGYLTVGNENPWKITSNGGAVYPTNNPVPGDYYSGNVVIFGSTACNGDNVVTTSGTRGTILLHGNITAGLDTSGHTATAGTTTYYLPSQANLATLDGDLTYLKNLYFSAQGQATAAKKPSTVALSGGQIAFTFASSLNPSSTVTSIQGGIDASGAKGTMVIGNSNYTNATNNLLIGNFMVSTGAYSLLTGQGINNTGQITLLVGSRLKNTGGNRCLLVGADILNTKNNALLIGQGHDTTNGSNGVAAVGVFSSIASDTAFVVGNGTSTSVRSNAFVVHSDGRATVGAAPTADMDVATKKYVDDNGGGGSGTVDETRSTISGNAIANSAITNYTAKLPFFIDDFVGTDGTGTKAGTVSGAAAPIIGDKLLTKDGWIGTVTNSTFVSPSVVLAYTCDSYIAPHYLTVETTAYKVTRKALTIVDGSTTTTYYVADIT